MKKPKTMLEIFIEEGKKDGMEVYVCKPRPLGPRKQTRAKATSRNGSRRISRPR